MRTSALPATESANGVDVRISRVPGKPLILLVRMASREMGVWETVWEPLCEHFTVAQFDLRLPSLDALNDPAAAFGSLAEHCVRVANALGFAHFHMLGWTGGAHIALRCAVDHPDAVRSCTLVSPFYPLPDMRSVEKGIEFMQTLMEHGGRELYSYYWFMSGLSPNFLQSRFDSVAGMVQARMSGDRFIKADTTRAIQWIRALRGFWIDATALEKLRTPILIVGPGLDCGFVGPSSEMASRLHAAIPGSELALADGYASLFLLEAPEVFVRLSKPFFERVTGPQSG